MTYDQLSQSGLFFLGAVGTGLLLAAAFGLWAYVAKATVRNLDLALPVRVGEMLLATLTATAVLAMLPFGIILDSATQSSFSLLLLGVAALAAQSAAATSRIRRAVRRGRRLRAAAGRGR